jgi:cation transport ATPase
MHLRKAGFTRIVLASGDQRAVVGAIAAQLDLGCVDKLFQAHLKYLNQRRIEQMETKAA